MRKTVLLLTLCSLWADSTLGAGDRLPGAPTDRPIFVATSGLIDAATAAQPCAREITHVVCDEWSTEGCLGPALCDFKTALERVTGRPVELRNDLDPGQPGYLLALAGSEEVPRELASQLTGRHGEAYLLHLDRRGNLLLVSSTRAGLRNAVYGYLHRAGVRYFLPGDSWTLYPEALPTPPIRPSRKPWPGFSLTLLQEPAFTNRLVAPLYGLGSFPKEHFPEELHALWARHLARNRYLRLELIAAGETGGDFNKSKDKVDPEEPCSLTIEQVLRMRPELRPCIYGLKAAEHGGPPAPDDQACGPDDQDRSGYRVPYSSGMKPDYGQPDFRAMFIAHKLRLLRANRQKWPQYLAVSTSPSDGPSYPHSYDDRHCACRLCRDLGTVTDRQVDLSNATARVVKEEIGGDGVGVAFVAYNHHLAAPVQQRSLAENLWVTVAPYYVNWTGQTPEELLSDWGEVVHEGRLGVSDHWALPMWNLDLPRFPVSQAVERIRVWWQHGVSLSTVSTSFAAAPLGLPHYLAARLLWDPDEDEAALRDDFYARAFGSAAGVMRELMEEVWGESFELIPSHLGVTFQKLQQALETAAGDPAVERRLEDMVRYAHYLHLRYDYEHARWRYHRQIHLHGNCKPEHCPDAPPPTCLCEIECQVAEEYRRATDRLLTYIWRLYPTGLVHTHALARGLYKDGERDGKYPGLAEYWSPKKGPNEVPWREIEPVAAGEVRELLLQGAHRFRPPEPPLRRYSRDYVSLGALLQPPEPEPGPVCPPSSSGPDVGAIEHQAARQYFYCGPTEFPFYAPRRGRWELVVEYGRNLGVEDILDPPPARFSVHDASGRELQIFRLRGIRVDDDPAGEVRQHRVVLQVPAEGAYTLRFFGPNQLCFSVTPPDDLPLAKEGRLTSASGKMDHPMYFYVPVGTRRVIFTSEQGLATVDNPTPEALRDGVTILRPGRCGQLEEVPLGGVFGEYSFEVPEGASGRVWGVKIWNAGLRLVNVPSLFAYSPRTLVVPRELISSERVPGPA